MKGAAYHHGDLKRVLLETAAKELETEGYENLSLRGLAQHAGVTTRAPYRHFASREALLLALAIEGAEILGDAYQAARTKSGDAIARLRAVCEAYLELAERRPQLFRLMFVSDVIMSEAIHPDWSRAVQAGYDLFEQSVAEAFPGLDPAGLRSHAAFCWATIHGLALLRLHGRFERFTSRGDQEGAIIARSLDYLLSSAAPERRSDTP